MPLARLVPAPAPAGGDPPSAEDARRHVYRGPDRRRRPTPRLSRFALLGGRRRRVRRRDEREGAFVDLYDARLLLLAGWVALMNCLDSFFTLYHLQSGGIELNPVADALLRTGRESFVVWKSALISVALLVLCLHKNFSLARIGLAAATATYTLLVGYHIWLLQYA